VALLLPASITLVSITLAACTLAACSPDGSGPSSEPDGANGAPAGIELEQYRGDGFSLLLPVSWTIVTPEDLDFATLFADAGDFAGSAALEQQVGAAFTQGGKLFAIDFSTAASGFVTSLSLIALPLPALTAAEVEAVTVQQLEDLLQAADVSSEIRSLPAGEAVVVRYRMPGSGSRGIGATLLTADRQWVMTLSGLDLDPLEDAFWRMIESFREA
jgi:hypothetical protein